MGLETIPLLLAFLVLLLSLSELEFSSKRLDLPVVQLTDSLDSLGDFGDGFTLSNGISRGFSGLDQIAGDFLNELSRTRLDLRAGNGGDEEWAQGSFFHGWHGKLSLKTS